MKLKHILSTTTCLLPSLALAQGAENACEALLDFDTDAYQLEITDARWHEAREISGGFPGTPATQLPVHCRVDGIIERRTGVDGVEYGIRFALNLPADWNGRFLFQGGGGLNGSVNEPLGNQATGGVSALERGFAVVSNDTGHQAAGGFDASFRADQEASLNFFYKANPKVAELAKSLVAIYYGEAAHHSYFVGCSTGGREAMIMSQRYPTYFDGIVSGAPAMRTGLSNLGDRWVQVHLNTISDRDENGQPIPGTAFTDDQQAHIVDSIVTRCDALDGAEDGLIFNQAACDFDPRELACSVSDAEACLTDEQALALAEGFAGPKDSLGRQVYPGFVFDPGIDDMVGLPGLLAGIGSPVQPEGASPYEQDVDAEYLEATRMDNAIGDSTSLNLSTFHGEGGKLIFYHGNTDPWFSSLDTVQYYENMAAVNGGLESVQDWSRVFLVPGMGHCQGGERTVDSFDMLSAVVDWVENDAAPAQVEASGQSVPGVTRPLCPWPQYARYNGSGDINDAENYRCEE